MMRPMWLYGKLNTIMKFIKILWFELISWIRRKLSREDDRFIY